MQVKPILQPNSGERVAGSSPPLQSRVEDWNRRLNLFSGRALSDLAMTGDQEGRAGRLALRGQLFSPGIVSGLEVEKSDPLSIHLAAGLGFTVDGEEIFVPTASAVNLKDARVFLNGALDDTLGIVIAAGKPVPTAAIVVLQPVTIQMIGNPDPNDPCEADPSNDPFDDQILVDGCRVVLFAWPDMLGPLPAHRKVLRNRLAWTIYNFEDGLLSGQAPPWSNLGVPIALVGFDVSGSGARSISFLDRYAAARDGGRPRRRGGMSANSILWQARMQQFEAQLFAEPAGAGLLAQQFVRVPPAGILPRDAVDLQTGPGIGSRVGASNFFPASYRIHAAPVVLEQLDAVIQASAGLAPYRLVHPDEVNLLVPVPQIYFEPNLLDIEEPSPEFAEELARSRAIRGVWLKRRQLVRDRASALNAAVTGKELTFPDPDPEAVDNPEDVAANEIDTSLGITEFETAEDTFQVDAGGGVGPINDLTDELKDVRGVVSEFPVTPLDDFIARLERRANNSDNLVDLGYLRAQTNIYRVRQVILDKSSATRLSASTVLAEIALGDSALASHENLLAYLGTRATIPNDKTSPPSPTGIVGGSAQRVPQGDVAIPAAVRSRNAGLLPVKPVNQQLKSAVQETNTLLFSASARQAAQPVSTIEQVQQQAPILGSATDVRTLSVVKRLDVSPAIEARNYAVAGKYSALTAFLNPKQTETVIATDLRVPGFRDPNRNELFLNLDPGKLTKEVLTAVLNGDHDAPPDNADEGGHFAAAVRAMENTIQVYGMVESRIQSYRRAVASCRDVRDQILEILDAAQKRLQVLDNEIAGTRHDVTVEKALLADEQARVDAVNQRRDSVLNANVTFLAYHRPRFTSLSPIDDEPWIPPVRSLDPGESQSVIPACLDTESDAPPELRTMVNLLRDAPVRWFSEPPVLLDRIDRLPQLSSTILYARNRASFQLALPASVPEVTPGPLQASIASLLQAHADISTQNRLLTLNTDIGAASNGSWSDLRATARQMVSVGDLIDFGELRPEVNRLAASSLEDIYSVSSCLYASLASVQPVIRLAWAEGLSQFDGPVNLRVLTNLPRWNEVSRLDAKHMQSMVDWLFQRFDASQQDAVTFFNNLIRVCVLLASHSPVNQIVAGALARPAPAVPGGILQVNVDHLRVAVGMAAVLYQGTNVVGRAVVDNVATGQAAVRVISVTGQNVNLIQGSRVQFATTRVFA